MGILLALVAAAAWGASSVFARLGFRTVTSMAGTFASMLSSLALIVLITLVFQRQALASVSVAAVLWFALIGLINFPFARYVHFRGVELIGASRASALSSAAPLFAMLAGVSFLGERLTAFILTGILLIIGGLYSLAHQPDNPAATADAGAPSSRAHRYGYIFSLLAAASWGGTSALTRWSLTHLAPPLVGAFVAVMAGTLALSPTGIRNLRAGQMSQRSGLGYFLLAGLVSAIGITANYGALSLLPVVVASPLANTSPLFTLLFVFAFLRRWERITWKTAMGAVLVIAGGIFITLGRVE